MTAPPRTSADAPAGPLGGSARRAREVGQAITRTWSAHPDVLLVVTVWVGMLVPQLAASLAVAKGFTPITEPAGPTPPAVAVLTTLANALIVLVCAATVLLGRRRVGARGAGVLVALLAPWLIAAGELVVAGRAPGPPAVVFPAVVLAFWVVRPGAAAVQALGYLTGVTAVVSMALGAFDPAAGRYPAEAAGLDKAIGAAGILSGVMPSGNNLGLVLVLGLPTVLVIRRQGLRWAALGAVLAALAWTSSRTSWVAAVVVLGLLGLLALVRRRAAAVTGLGLGALAAGGIILPFLVTDPTSFVNRAGYWIASLDVWRERPLVGFGADFYGRLAGTPDNLGGFAYHAHNQWVQLLVTGGILLTVAVLVLLVLAGVRAARGAAGASGLMGAGSPWAAGWLAAFLTVAVLEVPLGLVDRGMFWPVTLVPLCVLLCAPGGRLGGARA